MDGEGADVTAAPTRRARRVRDEQVERALAALDDPTPAQRRAVEQLADGLTARLLTQFGVGEERHPTAETLFAE